MCHRRCDQPSQLRYYMYIVQLHVPIVSIRSNYEVDIEYERIFGEVLEKVEKITVSYQLYKERSIATYV